MNLSKICNSIKNGFIGVIIWPFATCFSLRKMGKILRDPEISTIHTICRHDAQIDCCPTPCLRYLDRNRPDEEATDLMDYLSSARYKMPLKFIIAQQITLILNIVLIIISGIGIAVIENVSAKYELSDHFALKFFGNVSLAINGILGFSFCLFKDLLDSAKDAVLMPLKSLCNRNPKFITQHLVLKSALRSNCTPRINSIIQNNGRGDVNTEFLNASKRINSVNKVLIENTPLMDDITNIILQYSFRSAFVTLADTKNNRAILPSFNARIRQFEQLNDERIISVYQSNDCTIEIDLEESNENIEGYALLPGQLG